MSAANSRPPAITNGVAAAIAMATIHGGHEHQDDMLAGVQPPGPPAPKKGKQKKPPEPTDTSALIQAKIFELEKSKRGEEGENEELGR